MDPKALSEVRQKQGRIRAKLDGCLGSNSNNRCSDDFTRCIKEIRAPYEQTLDTLSKQKIAVRPIPYFNESEVECMSEALLVLWDGYLVDTDEEVKQTIDKIGGRYVRYTLAEFTEKLYRYLIFEKISECHSILMYSV